MGFVLVPGSAGVGAMVDALVGHQVVYDRPALSFSLRF
jgi:hypothetical protein